MCSNLTDFDVEAAYLDISPNDLECSVKGSTACWCGPWVVPNVLAGVMQKVEFRYKCIFYNIFPLEDLMLWSKSLGSYVVSVKGCMDSN